MDELDYLFVPYEIALPVRDKGFNKKCLRWYIHGTNLNDDTIFLQYRDDPSIFCYAPTYQQVEDWLDSKGIYVCVSITTTNGDKRYWAAYVLQEDEAGVGLIKVINDLSDRHEARAEGIKHAITLLP